VNLAAARELLYQSTLPRLAEIAGISIPEHTDNHIALGMVLGVSKYVAKDTVQRIVYGILLSPNPLPGQHDPSMPAPGSSPFAEALRLRMAIHNAVAAIRGGTGLDISISNYIAAVEASRIPGIKTSKGQILFFGGMKETLRKGMVAPALGDVGGGQASGDTGEGAAGTVTRHLRPRTSLMAAGTQGVSFWFEYCDTLNDH
jgi:hypothetical protein